MSDDQVGCEWVSVSFGTGAPGLSRTKAVKRLCVCVAKLFVLLLITITFYSYCKDLTVSIRISRSFVSHVACIAHLRPIAKNVAWLIC